MHIVLGSGLGQMIAATRNTIEDRVANVLPQKARADDAEQRQEKDEDRHLEADAKAENDREKESCVLLDGDHGVEFAAEPQNQDFERSGQYKKVSEGRADEKQPDRRRHEGNDEPLLLLVEPRRNEQPHLVKNEGRSENGAADESYLQVQVERVHGVRVVELDAKLVERRLHKAVQSFVEVIGHEEADSKINGGVDDALAQLLQMLHQAHAGQVGALGDCFPCLADCVSGINHCGPAPSFYLRPQRRFQRRYL